MQKKWPLNDQKLQCYTYYNHQFFLWQRGKTVKKVTRPLDIACTQKMSTRTKRLPATEKQAQQQPGNLENGRNERKDKGKTCSYQLSMSCSLSLGKLSKVEGHVTNFVQYQNKL